MDFIISVHFRALVLRLFPELEGWQAGLRLLGHLLFAGASAADQAGIRVGRQTLARMEGKEAACRSNNYCGLDLLEAFRRVCFPHGGFAWSDYSFVEGRCRVAYVDWPAEIQAALPTLHKSQDDLVYLVSGRAYCPASVCRQRKECRAAVANAVGWDKAREIAAYLNSLSPAGFKILKSNASHAEEVARRLLVEGKISDAALDGQLRALRQISLDPVPVYQLQPTRRTDRIFAEGVNVCGLKREVRKAISAGWWEADLKSAQLAIVAKLWDIPELTAFLQGGGSFWEALADWLGLTVLDDRWPEAKDLLKEMVYALIFGMSLANLREYAAELEGMSVSSRPLLEHPLLRALWKARQRRMKELWKAGRLRLHYGREISFVQASGRERIRAIRSALACEAQALELDLIHSVYHLAATTKDFRVMLHQHDGVSIAFSRRTDLWRRRINAAVQERAEELGVLTRLEWEELKREQMLHEDPRGLEWIATDGTHFLQPGPPKLLRDFCLARKEKSSTLDAAGKDGRVCQINAAFLGNSLDGFKTDHPASTKPPVTELALAHQAIDRVVRNAAQQKARVNHRGVSEHAGPRLAVTAPCSSAGRGRGFGATGSRPWRASIPRNPHDCQKRAPP